MPNSKPVTKFIKTDSLSSKLDILNRNQLRNGNEVYEVTADIVIDSWESGGVTEYAQLINIDETAGNVTLSLPPAADNPGRQFTIRRKSAGGNTVTIDVDGGGTINGAADTTLAAQYNRFKAFSDGAEYCVW